MTIRMNFTAAAVGAAVLAFAGMAQASTTVITGLYNTGVGADYASVGVNGVEQHWTLDGGTAYVGGVNGVFPLNGPWLTENATSRWIGPTVIAEPKALIGFAGPRVIEQTVRETLPEGFQRAEFLLEKGAIDMIVDRRHMRDRVAQMITLLQKEPAPVA